MTDKEILERLTDIYRYVFDYDGDTLTERMTAEDIEGLDSMSNITLALEIEKHFGVKIKMAELESLKSVRALVALIKSSLPLSRPDAGNHGCCSIRTVSFSPSCRRRSSAFTGSAGSVASWCHLARPHLADILRPLESRLYPASDFPPSPSTSLSACASTPAGKTRPANAYGLLSASRADLAVLVYYKYLGALIGLATGLGLAGLHAPAILLPLGISFFTFTQIAYLVDMQQGVVQDRSPLNYALFVTFFPHLIAGPILHNREMMPQFAQSADLSFLGRESAVGGVIFIIGLAKKCLFADPIAGMVAAAFRTPGPSHHGQRLDVDADLCGTALFRFFRLYGHGDRHRAHVQCTVPGQFQLTLLRRPALINFWQRWHMTLTRLLTLYLFNPLALAAARRRAARGLPVDRKAQAKPAAFLGMTAIPLFITMGTCRILAWGGAAIPALSACCMASISRSTMAGALSAPHYGPASRRGGSNISAAGL